MSAWPGKYVIGLTGNIATGKSVVRRMLEHLGAYGIDADALGHRAIAKGAPGYEPVVETFGRWILSADGQVDRTRLARVVFSDAEALARLETIVHPLVAQAVDLLVRRSRHRVIVLEAIKLIESGLQTKCDNLWVAHAPKEIQLARLMQKRQMSEALARQRIASQTLQEQKLASADVIINNYSSFEDTWEQVLAAWQAIFPAFDAEKALAASTVKGGYTVERARPRQAKEIATYITRVSDGQKQIQREDIMEAFGEKAFMLLRRERRLVGLLGWQVENLVARTDNIYLDADLSPNETLGVMLQEVETASKELQCEIILLFVRPEMARDRDLWMPLGYQHRTIASLGVRAWQEAATESMPANSVMMFKQLRKDRVLRPV